MVMIVRGATDGDGGRGEKEGEEKEEVEGWSRGPASECPKFSSDVKENKSPGDERKGGMTRRETLSSFNNYTWISIARQICSRKGTVRDFAVRPASEDEVRSWSTDTEFDDIGHHSIEGGGERENHYCSYKIHSISGNSISWQNDEKRKNNNHPP